MTRLIQLSIRHPHFVGSIQGFRWFWAYVVTGFDSRKHCQSCFKGWLSPQLNSTNASTGDFAFAIPEGAFLYICGVGAGPLRLRRERNLHLPLLAGTDSSGRMTSYNGYTFSWNGAKHMALPEPQPRLELPEAHYRCANFRVAEAWFQRATR